MMLSGADSRMQAEAHSTCAEAIYSQVSAVELLAGVEAFESFDHLKFAPPSWRGINME
jgi:hypothetical protein